MELSIEIKAHKYISLNTDKLGFGNPFNNKFYAA